MSGLFALLIMAIRIAPIAAALALSACGFGANPSVADACDRVAARDGHDRNAGTAAAPFRSAQRLADALRPGQTGCLRAGTYDDVSPSGYVLKFFHGGRPGSPITVRSYPGERAKLQGVVYFPEASPHVTLRDVDIDGRGARVPGEPVTVQLLARGIVFEGNDVTNRGLKTCMILGSNSGWGQAVRPVIRRNVFHGCGNPDHGLFDHAIYAENVVDAEITRNVFWGNAAFAVHLYPNAQRSRITRNVMADNGGGVIFAGENGRASSGNVVERNVIAGSRRHFNIAFYWPSREGVGAGNIARDNCVYDGASGNIARQVGFVARDNVIADPRFANPAARDYRPAAGTPCTNLVGTDVGAGVAPSGGAAGKRAVPSAARMITIRRTCSKGRTAAARKRCVRAAAHRA